MITVKEQNSIFIDIAKALRKQITVYAIGGTAMIFHGIKKSTLDIDLVFSDEGDRKSFKSAVKSLGYEESDAKIFYGKKENTPEMINVADGRIDLFLFKIITSTFSDEMQKRAKKIHEFDKNLIIKVADIHDIIIMKSITTREKDEGDIIDIIKNIEINWDIIISEAKNQVNLGNARAVMDVGYTFERIKNNKLAEIPKYVLDSLWDLLKNQIGKKKRFLKKEMK